MKDSRPFTKLKEVFCQRTCRHKNTTFNFAQPHRNPSHKTTVWTVENLEDKKDFISYLFTNLRLEF
jgi:hypothetical protein